MTTDRQTTEASTILHWRAQRPKAAPLEPRPQEAALSEGFAC